MSDRPLLTVKQACARLTVGRSKVDALLKSGKLTAVRLGTRSIRIHPDELDRFVESASEKSTSVQESVSRVFDADSQFVGDNPFM